MKIMISLTLAGSTAAFSAAPIDINQKRDYSPFSVDAFASTPAVIDSSNIQEFRKQVNAYGRVTLRQPRQLNESLYFGRHLYLEAAPRPLSLTNKTLVSCDNTRVRYQAASDDTKAIQALIAESTAVLEKMDKGLLTIKQAADELNRINTTLRAKTKHFNEQKVVELSQFDRIMEYSWSIPFDSAHPNQRISSRTFEPTTLNVPSAPDWDPEYYGGDLQIPYAVDGYPAIRMNSIVFQQYMSPLGACLSAYGMEAAGSIRVTYDSNVVPQICIPSFDPESMLASCKTPEPGQVSDTIDVTLKSYTDPNPIALPGDSPKDPCPQNPRPGIGDSGVMMAAKKNPIEVDPVICLN